MDLEVGYLLEIFSPQRNDTLFSLSGVLNVSQKNNFTAFKFLLLS